MSLPTRILGRTNFPVSVLGLGTAEIGFLYGIGKKSLPTDQEAEALLRFAVEGGITYFDTAHLYQLSEERIGRSGILKDSRVLVGTKCGQFLEKGEKLSATETETRIRAEVEESRQKLQIDTLPLVFLHGASEDDIKSGVVTEILTKLKSEQKIKWTAVSTRGDAAPLAAIESGAFDVIQIARSILDQRMDVNVLPAAQKANIGVINRSVFLKGVLTPRRSDLPAGLHELISQAEKAEAIAGSLNISLQELAIRFAISHPTVATALIGTNKREHVEQMIQAVQKGPLSADIIAQLAALKIDDAQLVDPAKWPPLP
jgi:aryl-alcohol dehydrogenase-like predicted oxidoreductase